jgi:hypothetical protein
MKAAFQLIKDKLCTSTQLAHPDPRAEISLAADALDWCVGTILQQRVGSDWQLLALYSKKLGAAQHKYSALDRELLAAYLAVRHFRFQLEGRQFMIFTDHKTLTFAIRKQSEQWTARQQRQLSYLAKFSV